MAKDIDKHLTHYSNDNYLCCAYVSPKTSCRYRENDMSKLDRLYNDVITYKEIGHLIPMGDLYYIM